ncbi:MAG TPA: hypothetical protein VFQ44_03890 [Streptosporangiaceae bacterium]|nr:hypothetical protein [Streptosporangiaceae bacterium]
MQNTKSRYDGHAEWYEEWNLHNAEGNAVHISEMLAPGTGLCLDLGCGGGQYLGFLSQTGRRVR